METAKGFVGGAKIVRFGLMVEGGPSVHGPVLLTPSHPSSGKPATRQPEASSISFFFFVLFQAKALLRP